MENVTEKIRKLLAKASSNNEHEASAALLKARELMAKYKIDEKSVQDTAQQDHKLNHEVYTGDTFSNLRNTWYRNLSNVIAQNHCCAMVVHLVSKSTNRIAFTGLDDDPAVALELFDYAAQHIKSQAKEYSRYIRDRKLYPSSETNQRARAWEDSYADGFSRGLQAKYDEQLKKDESGSMALVLVRPVEVDNYLDTLGKKHFKARYNGENASASRAGFTAGYTFNPTKQIPARNA